MPSHLPLPSRRPRRISIFSVSPLAASLNPARLLRTLAPGASAVPGQPNGTPTLRHRVLRHAVPIAAALGVVGALYAVTTHRRQSEAEKTRAAASPGVKTTASGASVRWRRDALDVVVDESFSKLAGPRVYSAAVDAWRATGAVLPSVSTKPGDGRKVGFDPGGQNENVIVYAPFGWSKAKGALAITVLTYDDMTGGIVDADVLINGGGRFFGVFDSDESDQSSAGVSIEGKDGDDVTSIQAGKTPRFDVQNVLTHELGHFFGLGEDYADIRATMYASTRPGETNKRIVSSTDGSVVSALYAEPMAAASSQTQAGCGGAKLARGHMPDGSAIAAFGAATAGLILLAASRRGRAARLVPVRVRARRSGLARFGGWLTVLSTFALLSPPRLEAAPSDQATGSDAEVQVTGSATHWTDGILETELSLRVTTCHVANCSSDQEQKVVIPGGHLGGVTQVVGPYAVPAVGEQVKIRFREPRSLLQPFRPNPYHRP